MEAGTGTERQRQAPVPDPGAQLHWGALRGKAVAGKSESAVFINKYYLARIFREQYGCTVNTCIAQTRIGKVKELLRFTDKTVEEIGQDCGFPDANYFARSFKKSRALPQRTTADSGKCRSRKLSAIQKHPGAGAHRLCIRSRDVFEKSQAATLTSRLRLSKKGCALF